MVVESLGTIEVSRVDGVDVVAIVHKVTRTQIMLHIYNKIQFRYT